MYPSKAKAEALGIHRRQRYRCYPSDGGKPHDFTPAIPRLAVAFGHEHCVVCNELTGVHHGKQSSARKHQSLLTVVVDTLEKVATGTPYTRASLEAREQLGNYKQRSKSSRASDGTRPKRASRRTVPVGEERRVSQSAKKARSHWHIAADWVEIYAPVCWRETVTAMRAVEDQQARHPDPARPRVMLLDAVPAQSKKGKTASRKRWHILAAAQVVWGDNNPVFKQTRLRQVRAMPVENRVSWQLFFDELDPYQPDYVVADLGRAQVQAVKETWGDAVIIPSMYHLLHNLEGDLKRLPHAQFTNDNNVAEFHPEVVSHLQKMNGAVLVKMTLTDWGDWWDELDAVLSSLGCDTKAIALRRERVTADMEVVLPHLNRLNALPLSTGGLELLLSDRVKPLFERRQHAFANIERTNHLLDLVVCATRGFFLDKHKAIELIRRDNEEAEGWSLAPRQVADRMTLDPATNELHAVSSLSDYSLIASLAMKKGYM